MTTDSIHLLTEKYCNLILAIAGDTDYDIQYRMFVNICMARFLILNSNHGMTTEEALLALQVIKNKWQKRCLSQNDTDLREIITSVTK